MPKTGIFKPLRATLKTFEELLCFSQILFCYHNVSRDQPNLPNYLHVINLNVEKPAVTDNYSLYNSVETKKKAFFQRIFSTRYLTG